MASALLAVLAVSCSGTSTPRNSVPVEGVVRMPDGSPVAGGTVAFFEVPSRGAPSAPLAPSVPRSQIFPGQPIAATDAQGRFSIRLPVGIYEVWVGGGADSGSMSLRASDVTVRPPRVRLDLHYAAFRVSGRMVGHGGTVIASGHVFVLSGTNTANAEIRSGLFRLLLPADTYGIWATPDAAYSGFPRLRFDSVAVASDTTFDLSVDGNEVTGTVTGPGGMPLEGAFVSGYASTASAYSPTASDGTYRIYLPTREYAFRVSPGHGRDSIGVRDYPPILIDSPRTLDFDLSGPPVAAP